MLKGKRIMRHPNIVTYKLTNVPVTHYQTDSRTKIAKAE